MKVRKGPGLNYGWKRHGELTADGRKHHKDRDGFLDKGTVVTCLEVKQIGANIWIRCPSGWIAAYHNGNLYVK